MNKKITSLLFAVVSIVALSVLAPTADAQTALTSTTLSAAVAASNQQSIHVASATGITAKQTLLFVDDEALFVNSVSGTTIGVSRGYQGTPVEAHLSGQTVLLGPPQAFNPITSGVNANGDPFGGCTAGNTLYTPFVNIKNGRQWLCSSLTNSWVPGWGNISTPAGVTTAVASVAGATLPSGPLFHMTGTNAITSFTVPLGFPLKSGAGFCVIPDAAYTTVAGNNVGTTSTAVANKTQCWTYDVNAGKFYASY